MAGNIDIVMLAKLALMVSFILEKLPSTSETWKIESGPLNLNDLIGPNLMISTAVLTVCKVIRHRPTHS